MDKPTKEEMDFINRLTKKANKKEHVFYNIINAQKMQEVIGKKYGYRPNILAVTHKYGIPLAKQRFIVVEPNPSFKISRKEEEEHQRLKNKYREGWWNR